MYKEFSIILIFFNMFVPCYTSLLNYTGILITPEISHFNISNLDTFRIKFTITLLGNNYGFNKNIIYNYIIAIETERRKYLLIT